MGIHDLGLRVKPEGGLDDELELGTDDENDDDDDLGEAVILSRSASN